jgi:hypothetical protein
VSRPLDLLSGVNIFYPYREKPPSTRESMIELCSIQGGGGHWPPELMHFLEMTYGLSIVAGSSRIYELGNQILNFEQPNGVDFNFFKHIVARL